MGNNIHGIKNQEAFALALHGKMYKEIQSKTLQDFIKSMYPNVAQTSMVKSLYDSRSYLVKITIEDKAYSVSIKTGENNSVQQESVESFTDMLACEYGIERDVLENIKRFIWGDGTLNGNGEKEDRRKLINLKEEMKIEIQEIQNCFNQNKLNLLKRVLSTGRNGSKIDYFYYGNCDNGCWCSVDQAIEFHLNNDNISSSVITLGGISFQAWNRCIDGNKKESQRGQVQFKWRNIEEHLKQIMSNG